MMETADTSWLTRARSRPLSGIYQAHGVPGERGRCGSVVRFSSLRRLHEAPASHPACAHERVFLGVKRPEGEAGQLPSGTGVEDVWSYTSTPPIVFRTRNKEP